MNRKGIHMQLRTVVELFLVAIILLATVAIFSNIYALFTGGGADQGSVNSFRLLAGEDGLINELLESDEVSKTDSSLMIHKKYIIVGFDAECGVQGNDKDCPKAICNGGDAKYNIPKPRKCRLASSCLCLFEGEIGDDFQNENNIPIECFSFDENVTFVGGGDFNWGYPLNGREPVVLYGYCKKNKKTFGVSQVYISESKVGDKVLITISTGFSPDDFYGGGDSGTAGGSGSW